jgi:hypothetical protein
MTSRAVAQERLEQANEIRIAGARLRRKLKAMAPAASRRKAAELLSKPPPEVQRMRLVYFLTGIQRVGPETAKRIVNEAAVPADRRIGPDHRRDDRILTARQRQAVARALLRRANGRWVR